MHYTYKLIGMTCNGCKASVEETLNAINGIKSTLINLEKGEAVLEMSSFISTEKLQAALPIKYSIAEANEESIVTPKALVEDSQLKQLKPLFLIFGYIIMASFLLHFKAWSWTGFMLDFMGLFYIVFSFFKLLDVKGFSKSFSMYDPLAKKISIYGGVYPFIEVGLGLLFLFRIQIPLALIMTLIILGITTIGVSKSLLDNKTIECACLGSVLKLPMTKATFIENAVMIIMSIIMLVNTYN